MFPPSHIVHRLIWAIAWIATVRPAGWVVASDAFTEISKIRRMSIGQVAAELPVRIRGSLIYHSEGDGSVVISGDEAIYCAPTSRFDLADLDGLQAGDVIELDGIVAPGHGAPVVEYDAMRWISHGPMPKPAEVTFTQLQAGPLDSQLVSISGVVHAADREPQTDAAGRPIDGPLRLIVSVPGGSLLFRSVADVAWDLDQLVDAQVRITGMCGPTFNSRTHFLKSTIRSFDPAGLEILKPAPQDAFAAPLIDLEDVLPFDAEFKPIHRQRILATVTAVETDQWVTVVSGLRGMKLYTRRSNSLRPGDVVQASGFIELEGQYPVMNEAVVKKVDTQPPPAPVDITRDRVLSVRNGPRKALVEDFEARLIRLPGRLVSIEDHRGSPFRLFVDCEGSVVTATLSDDHDPGRLRLLRAGSDLALVGICQVSFFPSDLLYGGAMPSDIQLWLRSPDDVSVLRASSWWTADRLGAALTWSLIMLLLALVVIETLRRRVAQRNHELAESRRIQREFQVGTEATFRERERLAMDLHDSLEQTLTGVALQIHATRTAPDTDKANRNLFLAEQMLNQSRVDLRRSVWNLRSIALEGHLLRDALSGIVAAIAEATRTKIIVGGRSEEHAIDGVLAQNVLLLAKEAVTNAIKHADASLIAIEVEYVSGALLVSIRDDGSGFDVNNIPRSHDGHFGLTGMQERVERIGGTLEIDSRPGHGTSILVKIDDVY